MFRTVLFYSSFVLSTLVTTAFLPCWHLLGILRQAELQRRLSHWTSFYWGRFLVWVSGTRVKIKGLENIPQEGAVLFVANHQSNFDIPILLGYINKPKAFLAKMELTKIPVVYSWMKKMDCVFIDRGDLRQSLKAINASIGVLNSGQSMVIFPEGTRSKGPTMGAFKKGSLRAVEKTDVPVVPLTIKGTYKIMEANNSMIRPAQVEIIISPPLYFGQDSNKRKVAEEIIRSSIEKNLT